MEEIIQLLKTDPEKAFAVIRKNSKDIDAILNYRKEYIEMDRTLRNTQVGKIQLDKPVGTGAETRMVRAVKIPINFAKRIVTVASAFEVGKPVTLIPSDDENDLTSLIKNIWKVNRVDSAIQKMVTLRKSETQSALQFYISDISSTSLLNKVLVKFKLKAQAKEIKIKVLENKNGKMIPLFDDNGNMLLFMWEYSSENISGKKVNNIQVWDKTKCYRYSDEISAMQLIDEKPHGFDRIPIVYTSQDLPEWYDVKEMIDRIETSFSKLGASNDYTAYPFLKIYGDVKSFPGKDDSGKVLQFPIKIDDEGKEHHGDGEFLESKGAAESQELELKKLEELIYAISFTPNTSFDNVKSIGTVSGVAIKLMFQDPMIKAAMNEGENRTMIERIVNVFISGIVNTTNTSLSKLAESLYYDIQFNSILPDDLKEAVDICSTAVNAGIMAKKTVIEYLGMNEDVNEELALIASDAKILAPVDPVV